MLRESERGAGGGKPEEWRVPGHLRSLLSSVNRSVRWRSDPFGKSNPKNSESNTKNQDSEIADLGATAASSDGRGAEGEDARALSSTRTKLDLSTQRGDGHTRKARPEVRRWDRPVSFSAYDPDSIRHRERQHGRFNSPSSTYIRKHYSPSPTSHEDQRTSAYHPDSRHSSSPRVSRVAQAPNNRAPGGAHESDGHLPRAKNISRSMRVWTGTKGSLPHRRAPQSSTNLPSLMNPTHLTEQRSHGPTSTQSDVGRSYGRLFGQRSSGPGLNRPSFSLSSAYLKSGVGSKEGESGSLPSWSSDSGSQPLDHGDLPERADTSHSDHESLSNHPTFKPRLDLLEEEVEQTPSGARPLQPTPGQQSGVGVVPEPLEQSVTREEQEVTEFGGSPPETERERSLLLQRSRPWWRRDDGASGGQGSGPALQRSVQGTSKARDTASSQASRSQPDSSPVPPPPAPPSDPPPTAPNFSATRETLQTRAGSYSLESERLESRKSSLSSAPSLGDRIGPPSESRLGHSHRDFFRDIKRVDERDGSRASFSTNASERDEVLRNLLLEEDLELLGISSSNGHTDVKTEGKAEEEEEVDGGELPSTQTAVRVTPEAVRHGKWREGGGGGEEGNTSGSVQRGRRLGESTSPAQTKSAFSPSRSAGDGSPLSAFDLTSMIQGSSPERSHSPSSRSSPKHVSPPLPSTSRHRDQASVSTELDELETTSSHESPETRQLLKSALRDLDQSIRQTRSMSSSSSSVGKAIQQGRSEEYVRTLRAKARSLFYPGAAMGPKKSMGLSFPMQRPIPVDLLEEEGLDEVKKVFCPPKRVGREDVRKQAPTTQAVTSTTGGERPQRSTSTPRSGLRVGGEREALRTPGRSQSALRAHTAGRGQLRQETRRRSSQTSASSALTSRLPRRKEHKHVSSRPSSVSGPRRVVKSNGCAARPSGRSASPSVRRMKQKRLSSSSSRSGSQRSRSLSRAAIQSRSESPRATPPTRTLGSQELRRRLNRVIEEALRTSLQSWDVDRDVTLTAACAAAGLPTTALRLWLRVGSSVPRFLISASKSAQDFKALLQVELKAFHSQAEEKEHSPPHPSGNGHGGTPPSPKMVVRGTDGYIALRKRTSMLDNDLDDMSQSLNGSFDASFDLRGSDRGSVLSDAPSTGKDDGPFGQDLPTHLRLEDEGPEAPQPSLQYFDSDPEVRSSLLWLRIESNAQQQEDKTSQEEGQEDLLGLMSAACRHDFHHHMARLRASFNASRKEIISLYHKIVRTVGTRYSRRLGQLKQNLLRSKEESHRLRMQAGRRATLLESVVQKCQKAAAQLEDARGSVRAALETRSEERGREEGPPKRQFGREKTLHRAAAMAAERDFEEQLEDALAKIRAEYDAEVEEVRSSFNEERSALEERLKKSFVSTSWARLQNLIDEKISKVEAVDSTLSRLESQCSAERSWRDLLDLKFAVRASWLSSGVTARWAGYFLVGCVHFNPFTHAQLGRLRYLDRMLRDHVDSKEAQDASTLSDEVTAELKEIMRGSKSSPSSRASSSPVANEEVDRSRGPLGLSSTREERISASILPPMRLPGSETDELGGGSPGVRSALAASQRSNHSGSYAQRTPSPPPPPPLPSRSAYPRPSSPPQPPMTSPPTPLFSVRKYAQAAEGSDRSANSQGETSSAEFREVRRDLRSELASVSATFWSSLAEKGNGGVPAALQEVHSRYFSSFRTTSAGDGASHESE